MAVESDPSLIPAPGRRLSMLLLAVPLLLLIPLVAMQFTQEVRWSPYDFLVAGALLLIAGSSLELTLRKVRAMRHRIVLGIGLFLSFFLLWVELAVGIFGSPLAGS